MGFGGGGSGSFALPDHTHTNALENGGALVAAASLINDGAADVTFDAWFAAKVAEFGLEKLYDSGDLSGVASDTFTPGTALDMDTDYAELIIVLVADAVSSTDFGMRLNGDSSASYDYNWIRSIAATVSGAQSLNDTHFNLFNNTNVAFTSIISVVKNSNDLLSYVYKSSAEDGSLTETGGGALDTPAQTTVSEIRMAARSGNFSGRVMVYGVRL